MLTNPPYLVPGTVSIVLMAVDNEFYHHHDLFYCNVSPYYKDTPPYKLLFDDTGMVLQALLMESEVGENME